MTNVPGWLLFYCEGCCKAWAETTRNAQLPTISECPVCYAIRTPVGNKLEPTWTQSDYQPYRVRGLTKEEYEQYVRAVACV